MAMGEGRALDAEVYSYALSGSGPDQQLLMFEQLAQNVEADLIIWAMAVHTIERIKAAHRKLVLENHPDKLVAEGLPEEFVALATEKLATINAAYDQIQLQRNRS